MLQNYQSPQAKHIFHSSANMSELAIMPSADLAPAPEPQSEGSTIVTCKKCGASISDSQAECHSCGDTDPHNA